MPLPSPADPTGTPRLTDRRHTDLQVPLPSDSEASLGPSMSPRPLSLKTGVCQEAPPWETQASLSYMLQGLLLWLNPGLDMNSQLTLE